MLSAALDWYYGSNEEFLLANCQFGEPFPTLERKHHKNLPNVVVRPGSFENGSLVNIFTVARKKKKHPTHLEESAKFLKTLRHPNILRFVGCTCVESEVHLVTEHAYPIFVHLKIVDAHEICSGLHDIALALKFIHTQASVSHNHVCCENIYVTESGSWKLGGFEHACRFSEFSKETIQNIHQATSIVLPEEKDIGKLKPHLIQDNGHARDVYMFGLLVDQFSEQIRFSSHVDQEKVRALIADMLRSDFENRPTFREILSFPILKSEYISIVHFLQSITLKSRSEKEHFFRDLLSDLEENHIFAEVVGRRLVPLLLTPIVFAEESAKKHVIQQILTPASEKNNAGILPENVFAQYVIPKILEMFKLRLLHVRITLLEHFANYVHLFEKLVLDDLILPEILVGLGDSNNQLVQASLHALADAVPVVGGDVIVGSGRRKIFSLAMPKFNGQALNGSQSLAYDMPLPPRAKLPPKKTNAQEARLPATLLELALRHPKKSEKKKRTLSDEAALERQKAFALSLSSTPVACQPVNHLTVEQSSSKVASNGPSCPTSGTQQVVEKPKRPAPVEVETWASSDEQKSGDESWLPYDDKDRSDFQAVEQRSGGETEHLTPEADLRFVNSTERTEAAVVNLDKSPNGPLKLQKPSNDKKQVTEKQTRPAGGHGTSPARGDAASKDLARPELGTEYEIVVKATARCDELETDFFADMAPDITPSSRATPRVNDKQPLLSRSGLEPAVDVTDVRSVDSGRGSSVSAAFHLVDDACVDVDGWDDELVTWE